MIEYGFTYDPQSNPRVILELVYTDGKDSPVYYRERGGWHEVPPESTILNYPILRIAQDSGDDAVHYWDTVEGKKDRIIESDVVEYIM